MPTLPQIAAMHDEMTEWRRDFHAHPELNYQEQRTSDLVAERLESWGIEVHRGLGQTGVIGVLRGGDGDGSIGLRADMDALPMEEQTNLPYRSTNSGVMHACGHDGHTTMLLGAAKYLAETRNFSGTVHFIFQPAEEAGAGAKRMIAEGLFDQFPCDSVWALHNAPNRPVGTASVRAGAVMAAVDTMKIVIHGKGSHAARPHNGNAHGVSASVHQEHRPHRGGRGERDPLYRGHSRQRGPAKRRAARDDPHIRSRRARNRAAAGARDLQGHRGGLRRHAGSGISHGLSAHDQHPRRGDIRRPGDFVYTGVRRYCARSKAGGGRRGFCRDAGGSARCLYPCRFSQGG